MAKRNIGKYRDVEVLPPGAMTVEKYAESRGWKANNVYMRVQRRTADFSLVIFQGINFVIPIPVGVVGK